MTLFCLFAALPAILILLRLLINLITLALPCWVGASVLLIIHNAGEGYIGAGLIGLVAGSFVYLMGIIACASARSFFTSMIIATLYALPAGITAYYLGISLAHNIFISNLLQKSFAFSFAAFTFILSWQKIMLLANHQSIRKKDKNIIQDVTATELDFIEIKMIPPPPTLPINYHRQQELPSAKISLND